MSAEAPGLDAPAILAIFDRHQVEYVVVGGYAANLHGSTRVTTDLDVTPNRTHTNLARLAAALRDLDGGIRVDDLDHGLAFDASRESPESPAGMLTLGLRTPHGDLDLTFEPDGADGDPDLIRPAEDHTIGTLVVRVACLADVIRSKTAAGRPKDLRALPELLRIQRSQQANLED